MTLIESFASKTGYRIVYNRKIVVDTTTATSVNLIKDAFADGAPMKYIRALVD